MNTFSIRKRLCSRFLFVVSVTLLVYPAYGSEPSRVSDAYTLKNLFEDAWSRQPEAKAYTTWLESLQARQIVSQSLVARPPTLELGGKGEKSQNGRFAAGGAGEFIAGLSIPIWLWGERSGSMAFADAEAARLVKQQASAQLKISAQLRALFWDFELAKLEYNLAVSRHNNAKSLFKDVQARHKAGDLSRADLYQSESALANAEGNKAEAKANLILAVQNLKVLTGKPTDVDIFLNSQAVENAVTLSRLSERLPKLPSTFADLDTTHPVIQDLIAQVDVARTATELARAQTRQNPELQIYGTSGRPEVGVPIQQTVMLGIKIPFGSDARTQAQTLSNKANQIEAEERLIFEKNRLLSELDGAKARVETAGIRRDAAIRRAKLANETRRFFEKSFKFGETDLPTRLRIEQEATDASKQAAQAEVAYLAAISSLRQALGLIPE